MRLTVLMIFLLLVLPHAAAAQRVAPPAFPSFEAASGESRELESPAPADGRAASRNAQTRRRSAGDLILPSLLGGIGTFWLTAYLGSRLHDTPCEDCGLEEGLYGAAMGFGIGAAAGAHLANKREGPFGKAALVGMAIGVAGTLAAVETDEWRILLAIPIAQIASAIAIERGQRRE